MFSETGSANGAGTTRPAPASDTVLLALLGEVAVRRDGGLAPVPGARARLLVAALATHPGRSRSAQALIDDVWGEDPPRAPMNALHTQVSRLRSILPEGALEIGPAGYRLVLRPDQVDLTLARQLETQARQAHTRGDDAQCLTLIAVARTLWRGDPAADLPVGSVADELTELAAARRQGLDTLELAAREAIGDLPGALELARSATAAQPFDEPAHGTLMRLLAAADRTNEALDVFASLRTRLVDQLGADPGPALAAMNTALLRGEPLPGSKPSGRVGTASPGRESAAAQSNSAESGWNSTGAGHVDQVFPAREANTGGAESRGDGALSYPPPAGPQGGTRGTDPDVGAQTNPAVAQGYYGRNTSESANPGTARGYNGGPADRTGEPQPGPAGEWQPAGSHRSQEPGDPGGWGSAQSLRRMAAAQHAAGGRDTAESTGTGIGLRAAPNPLLGREADIDALEGLLRTSRVTTVLGPGGTGKTRVANELGARVARQCTVALVELASLRTDPAGDAETRVEIEAAIATTLGVGEFSRDTNILRATRTRDLGQRLREALSARPILLILDNCEHLVDAVAELVADLVGASDQLTVLTTSRAPLQITAETVYPLPPLTIDAHGSPATELFIARARAVRPSVRLDPEVVARLCRTLDGLPLAIELAAARTRTMSVEEIESRLDHRFALLRSGDRSSPERHRTLHAVIEWSWNLLDGEQRTALRRLCRFPAGFTLFAAETVLAGSDITDAAAAIDGLVGQSLLTVLESDDPDYDGTRYRMLETVREYGEEQFAVAGDGDLVMERMACWAREFALSSARRYHGDDQVAVVLGVAAEVDNLNAVLRYAVDRRDNATAHAVYPVLATLWMMRGAHLELMSWSARMVTMPLHTGPLSAEEADLQMFGQLMLGLHLMFLNGEGNRDIMRVRGRIRRLLRDGGALSPAFRFLGEVAAFTKNGVQLGRRFSDGAHSRDAHTRVIALLLRANVRENSGDVYGSIRDAVRALTTGAQDDLWGTAMVCQHLGGMYAQSARYSDSVEYYRRAAELLTKLRAYDESVEIRSYLAVSLTGAGELEQARHELLPLLPGVGIDPGAVQADVPPNHRRATVTSGLAELELAEGDIDTGLARFRQALALMAWPNGAVAPGPGDLMVASAVIDAHVLHGHAAAIDELAGQLVEMAVLKLGQFWDLPQIGATATALGSHLLASGRDLDRGLEMLVLSPKVFARQDYPSMHWQRHIDLHLPVVGAARLEAAVHAATRWNRRGASERIMELMREIHESR